jgi:hypothetical protein
MKHVFCYFKKVTPHIQYIMYMMFISKTIAEFLEPERSSYTWIRAPEKRPPLYIVSDFGRGHCILSHLLSRVG